MKNVCVAWILVWLGRAVGSLSLASHEWRQRGSALPRAVAQRISYTFLGAIVYWCAEGQHEYIPTRLRNIVAISTSIDVWRLSMQNTLISSEQNCVSARRRREQMPMCSTWVRIRFPVSHGKRNDFFDHGWPHWYEPSSIFSNTASKHIHTCPQLMHAWCSLLC